MDSKKNPVKIIKFASVNLVAQLIIGGVMIGMGVYMEFIIPMLFGGVFMIISLANHSTESIRFYESYSEIKLLAVHPRICIENKNIHNVESNSNLLILKFKDGSEEKIKKIPLGYFSKNDRNEIVTYYEKNVKNEVSV